MRKIVILPLGLGLAVLLVIAMLVLLHGFPTKYMDLNDDQFISPAEVVRSLDLGHRTVRQGETTCVEIHQLKDGETIKHICW
ncbi:MAG: hypothetical protein AAFN63_09100 [Pseudomonadota bacterium]